MQSRFILTQYDNLKYDYSKLTETNRKQDAEVKKLKVESNKLSAQSAKEATTLDALDQYSGRQNLEIVGIPVTSNEDTNAIVQELLQETISTPNISTSHGLQTKSKSNPPTIIVRFVSCNIRNKIYSKCKRACNADFSKLSIKGVEKMYIDENLTYLSKRNYFGSLNKK